MNNPARVENFNKSGYNSLIRVTNDGSVLLESHKPRSELTMSDVYPRTGKTLYLNIIWHQHQPFYLHPQKDQLHGPWVRTHATKDYYDMVSILEKFPKVHYTVNLTSSLLVQLQKYYVDRLGPFVDVEKNRVDARAYFAKRGGTTDPWIDIALKNTSRLTEGDRDFLYRNAWNALGISEVMLQRFPEYEALKSKFTFSLQRGEEDFTLQELRDLKFWFFLAYFDPDFLEGPVRLPDGSLCDLSDYVQRRDDDRYYLRDKVTEADCNRIVAEAYKVMKNIVPIHKRLLYRRETNEGQVEVITTPFYHPILPLIYDSNIARTCQAEDPLPPRYHFPQDADAQVAKAVRYFEEVFGSKPTGMWPAEGSVSQDVVSVFVRNGIQWVASDQKVLRNSKPSDQSPFYPYQVNSGSSKSGDGDVMGVVFRETELSDRIGFQYQNYHGEEAADDFIQYVLRLAPQEGERDRLVTVILDGENAWEWYRFDNDGKEFLHALYRKLSKLHDSKQVVTVTPTEYVQGNPRRGVPPHPIKDLPRIEWLWPGSWINANFDTWIGEKEENRAWEYLLRTRTDLENSGLSQPDPMANPPKQGTKNWYAWMAWEELYAAEGSDWFWWYGEDQQAGSGDKPFDEAYLLHLNNVYRFAKLSGAKITVPSFKPIIEERQREIPSKHGATTGAMAKSKADLVSVQFTVDARQQQVPESIYIVGNRLELEEWNPNSVRMYDDGTHGDETPRDGIWSIEILFPVGTEVLYKFTNSGKPGEWIPGEEFPAVHRTYVVNGNQGSRIVLRDVFGQF